MSPILTLAKKDLRLLCRDRMDLFFTVVFPIFIGIFFGVIFRGAGDNSGEGGGSTMGIAVVDEDRTPTSEAFVARLRASDELDVLKEQQGAPLTRGQADDLVRKGSRVASVVIPKGFSGAADNIFKGEPIRLEGTIDPSRRAESGMLQGILTKHAFQNLAQMFGDTSKMRAMARKNLEDVRGSKDVDPAMKSALEAFLPSVEKFFTDADQPVKEGKGGSALSGWDPVKIELKNLAVDPVGKTPMPQSSFAWSFPQAVIWGILGCVTSFAVSLATERTSGTLTRLMLSPMSRWQILAGKGAACFAGCIVVAILVLLVGRLAFGIVPRSLPMLAVGVVGIGLGFVGVMMLVATMSRTASGASGAGRAVLLVLAMIGGGSIPLFAMPEWMQTVSSISPFKWAIQALDAGIWRPLTWAELAVPCAVLLGFGIAGFGLGARLFAWTERA